MTNYYGKILTGSEKSRTQILQKLTILQNILQMSCFIYGKS